MTPINIVIPETLNNQKVELESTLAGVAVEEDRLANQHKEIQDALRSIDTAIAVLSGQPLPVNKSTTATGRKPMSPEARQRIAEGLRKSAQARAIAKAARVDDTAPQEPALAPDDAARTETKREPRSPRKPVRIQ